MIIHDFSCIFPYSDLSCAKSCYGFGYFIRQIKTHQLNSQLAVYYLENEGMEQSVFDGITTVLFQTRIEFSALTEVLFAQHHLP